MLLDWFNAREAIQVGTSLADYYLPKTTPEVSGDRATGRSGGPGNDLQRFLQRAARDVRPLKLNLFKRAKLLNTFKWTLLERGCDRSMVDKLTELLLLQISGGTLGAPVSNGGGELIEGKGSALRRVPALMAEGDARFTEGNYEQAMARYREVAEINPRYALGQSKLGDALVYVGSYDEAEQAYRRALALKPNFVAPYVHLGNLLQLRGHFAESVTVLRRAVKKDPRSPEALACLGFGLGIRQEMSQAKECFEKALRLQPRNAIALCGAGWVAGVEGRFEEAEKYYRSALEADPYNVAAWAWLARLRRFTAADVSWLEGVERTIAKGVPPLDESRLRFAMGKYFDDLGQFSRAFEHYRRGNELYRKTVAPYDRAARRQFVDDMVRVYTRERLAQPREGASESAQPVLVTGMPRSGTSLVEQIIASHPAAAGAGELNFWSEAALRHSEKVRSDLPDAATAKQLADAYLKVLAGYSSDARRVVDKSTFNSNHLGLIHAVFPKARIIYLRRDPIDVCLSCHFQDFATAMSWTMDLSDLAEYYREHHRLMEHWRSALPEGTLLDVPYAELVEDPETWTRRIIEFIGLPWDPRCLEFHQTKRVVATASHWQVRQKVYSSSVGRWKNYQKFIKPLLELRDLG
jgi:tetratricopeptide (TPR) repeat protein